MRMVASAAASSAPYGTLGMPPAMVLESPQTQNWSDACLSAVRATTECVDWCIQNNDGSLTECIRNCLDAADLNAAVARLIARESPHARDALKACAEASTRCAESCESHSDAHASIERCAQACRAAAEACHSVAERQS